MDESEDKKGPLGSHYSRVSRADHLDRSARNCRLALICRTRAPWGGTTGMVLGPNRAGDFVLMAHRSLWLVVRAFNCNQSTEEPLGGC
jgi:hypothetical protein